MWSLFDFFPDSLFLNILDVGTGFYEVYDLEDLSYLPLLNAGKARLIGFEPNATAYQKLQETYGEPHRFFPYFVGDGQTATFYETNTPPTGSLFAPNSPLLAKFQNLSELVIPVASHSVDTIKLDDISEIEEVDFFKIDIQGGELSVFQNAKRLLQSTLVIQTEVEFVELYKEQPLFADIDIFLRSQGFQFFTFMGLSRRTFKPLHLKNYTTTNICQMLWGEALYVRDWLHLDQLSELQLAKYAILMHDLFAACDLSHVILAALDQKTGENIAEIYLDLLINSTPE